MEILHVLTELIADATGIRVDEIHHDSTFREFDIDALNMLDIVEAAEQHFGIDIPGEALKNFETVGDLAGYIDNSCRPLTS